jgi:hypothetical protein
MMAALALLGCGREEAATLAAPVAVATPAVEPALWFGGDVFVGALGDRGGVEDIVAIVGGAAGIVNLEGAVVAGAGEARIDGTTVWLANAEGTPAWLRGQGVVAASVANNHASDPGPDAPAGTVARLRAAGVAPFGGVAGVARLDVGGVDVRLVSHEVEEPGLAEALAAELVQGDIRVVSLHVTGGPSYLPTPALTRAVDLAVASGADIVVAHGTHVVGPVERRVSTRPGGEAVIAWGLGNLLFDCACTIYDEGMVVRVALGRDGPGVAEVLPVRAGLGTDRARIAPDPAGILDLLDALGGAHLTRSGGRGRF